MHSQERRGPSRLAFYSVTKDEETLSRADKVDALSLPKGKAKGLS